MQVVLSAGLLVYYRYIGESVMMYMCKYIKMHQGKENELIQEEKHRNFMLKKDYPMQGVV